MPGRRVRWALSGALLLVWLGVTTVDGLAQRLAPPTDGVAGPVPPVETATPGPDQRPAPRYGPSWIPPEPEGPPGSAALAPPLVPLPAALPAPPAPRAGPVLPLMPAEPPPTRELVVPRPQVGPTRGAPAQAPPTREVAPAAAPAAGAAAAAPP